MADVNGTERGNEEAELTKGVSDAREVEANSLVCRLREELSAVQAARAELASELEDAQSERAETAKLRLHAEEALASAKAAQKELQEAKDRASTAANKASQSAAAAKQHEDSIAAAKLKMENALGTVTANAKTINEQLAQVRSDAKTTASLAEMAETVEARVKEYEEGFCERSGRVDSLTERVEKLLPGATSAGLAESFLKSRKSKNKPRALWLLLFLVSMGGLVYSFFLTLPWQPQSGPDDGINWAYLLGRLPVAVPFSFIAGVALMYFRIESRMQDDYRHKQNLAASYEGFRKIMRDEKPDGSPASYELAKQTLAAIHAPPGRMYDRKGDFHTPVDGLVRRIVDGVTKGIGKDITSP